MTADPVQPGDDIGDCVADTRDFGETTFGNQHIEREGEGGQAIRCARVGLGSIGLPPRNAVRCAYSRSSVTTVGVSTFDIPDSREVLIPTETGV
jgi:hypothetical protein